MPRKVLIDHGKCQEDRLLTLRDAARRLSVSTFWLYKKCKAGWVTMVLFPCLIESSLFALYKSPPGFEDRSKMLLECKFQRTRPSYFPWAPWTPEGYGYYLLTKDTSEYDSGLHQKSPPDKPDRSDTSPERSDNIPDNRPEHSNHTHFFTYFVVGLAIIIGLALFLPFFLILLLLRRFY